MIAPGVWQDMGPSSAHGPSTRKQAEAGLPVGRMIPGPNVQLSNVTRTWKGVKARLREEKGE